jgi:hypothetical protein
LASFGEAAGEVAAGEDEALRGLAVLLVLAVVIVDLGIQTYNKTKN